MLPLIQDDDDVSRLLARLLVSLPVENNLLSIFHACGEGQAAKWRRESTLGQFPITSDFSHRTFVNVDLQNLLLYHDFSADAGFAAVLVADPLALSLTTLAHGGHLLHHTRYDLLHVNLQACAATRHAHLRSSFPTAAPCQDK